MRFWNWRAMNMHGRAGRSLVAAALLAVIGLTGSSAAAQATGVRAFSSAQARDGVNALEAQLNELEERYLVPAVVESRFRLESRFNDAKVAYLLADYPRASVLFVAVVDNDRVRQFDSYAEALYLLGDSLYQMRSFRAARSYFRRVVELGPAEFYQPAIVRLLEIAGEIDDYSGVDALYARLDNLEQVNPALHYTRGKTLYQEGRYQAAQPWFQRAARDPQYELIARYFEGVTLAADGDIAAAREAFSSLVTKIPSTPEESRVVDLGHLALGRLAYEERQFDRAIDHYLQLPRTSPYFERSLYELTWSLVSKESYQAALRNLDILLISDPDPRFVPEAKLLMADLSMRLRQYDQARLWFNDIIATFTPVRTELVSFIEEQPDLQSFFVELVRQDLEGLRPEYMPTMVSDWVDGEPLMADARQLVEDGAFTQADIDEAEEALKEVEQMLSYGSNIEAFPVLSEGWKRGVALEAQLISLEEQLIAYELQQAQSVLGPSERARVAELEEELVTLREQHQRGPQSVDDLQSRSTAIRQDFQHLNREMERVAFDIESLTVNLDGIDTYLSQNPVEGFSAEDRAKIRQIRQQMRDDISALQAEHQRLTREVGSVQRQFGARDAMLVQQRDARERYHARLSELGELIDEQSARLSTSSRSGALALAEQRRRLPELKSRLNAYFSGIDEVIDERVVDIRATVTIERQELASYQQELDQWRLDTERTVSSIALWNFSRVDDEFEALIRRGHVGLLDVGWQRKEDATRDINQLFEDRSTEINVLREAFREVR
ncbi:hypothetical protein DL240_01965 [Lujinxingia litoralis]|uniref:Uncharacterized protein n=1 Tax=Lujinxingia litoralis TaxID=2211119 RepID=A0A328CCN2_9DELT|nr:tetratricopeptide repeat protein [Lujinxingia litoralis]RAL25001.1 hypothetical protein DL240_01965 [Lujinxingia litoralis]